jgi:hypothetical protein
MAAPLSVLVVIASVDVRRSTSALLEVVTELDRRPDVRVATFVLRGDRPPDAWPRSRVVDDLRTWLPARVVERAGASRLAGRLRGLRLRSWLARERPDVVLLHQGLGGRVESLVRTPHVAVVRLDSDDAAVADEAPFPRAPDLLIVGPGCAADAQRLWPGVQQRTYPANRPQGARARVRARLGVPDGALLVTGRGEDGWLDGPDLFIRTMWELEHRCGTRAHGAWFGLGADPNQVVRLRDEIARCGLDGRVQIVEDPGDESIGSGDVTLLPYRHGMHPQVPMAEIAAGSPVVSFPVWAIDEPSLHIVPHLDLAAAAGAIVAAAGERRPDTEPTGPAAWADQFLADTESARR